MPMGFLTKTRQETGADNPKFGAGGSWVDIDAMVAREVVFAITDIMWDGDNMYDGKPRPRWVLDIIPWYEGETLPGKADDRGRLTQLDAGKLSLASHQSRDDMMDDIVRQFEEGGEDIVDGVLNSPGVLVKIRVPGGKGGRYTDLCEWDEENECAVLGQGSERAGAEDDEPRRPTGRAAPSRGRPQAAAQPQAARRGRPQAEPEPEPENDPPARSGAGSARRGGVSRRSSDSQSAQEAGASQRATTGSSGGFADAGGAESDGASAVPAPAGRPIAQADLNLVSEVVGGDPYESGRELADEYELEEGVPFPGEARVGGKTLIGIKKWLYDHGIDDFPEGRGRIKPQYRDAYSIALRCWMEYTGREADGQPAEGEPVAGGPDHTVPYDQQPGRQRVVQPAQVPANAHAADQLQRPADAPVRPEDKAAWMPPDQRERGGAQPASEHVYAPNDIGDSVEPCPDCQVVVTDRAFPSGGGSYGMMHKCPVSGSTKPLQATNIRKG
jgi:hypothetical protein